jgi:flagellar FliL protein
MLDSKKKKKEAESAETEEKEVKAPVAGGDGEEGAEGAEGAPKKSKKKLIIIGAVAAIVLIGGGVGAFMAMGSKGEHVEEEKIELGADGKPIFKPIFYTLPQFLINLNVPGKQSSFLKTTVMLELTKETDVQRIEVALPRIQDSINTYLRELRPSDIAGSAGIQRLREELLLRVNKIVDPVKVNDVLFKEIVVQ